MNSAVSSTSPVVVDQPPEHLFAGRMGHLINGQPLSLDDKIRISIGPSDTRENLGFEQMLDIPAALLAAVEEIAPAAGLLKDRRGAWVTFADNLMHDREQQRDLVCKICGRPPLSPSERSQVTSGFLAARIEAASNFRAHIFNLSIGNRYTRWLNNGMSDNATGVSFIAVIGSVGLLVVGLSVRPESY